MKSGGLQKNVVATCVAIAAASAVGGSLTGHAEVGFALSAGLLLGSLNGYLIQGLMRRGAPFAVSGLFRIMLFSSVVLVAAFTLRSAAWALALGIGLAQLVMVAVGVRQGLRR